MASTTVFHNPNCGKSRGVCQILDEGGVDFDPEIVALIAMLDDPPAVVAEDGRAVIGWPPERVLELLDAGR